MALHVVDTDTGELFVPCGECADGVVELRASLAKAEADARSWYRRYENLAKDLEREAAEDALWPQAVELFNQWRILLNHPKCAWDAKRFYLVKPMLKKDGVAMCRRAIAGAWFDAWSPPPRRNGTRKRLDEWDRIFRDRDQFEDYCNRAPAHYEALFVDEDTLRAAAKVPADKREPPAPLPVREMPPPPGSLFAAEATG